MSNKTKQKKTKVNKDFEVTINTRVSSPRTPRFNAIMKKLKIKGWILKHL